MNGSLQGVNLRRRKVIEMNVALANLVKSVERLGGEIKVCRILVQLMFLLSLVILGVLLYNIEIQNTRRYILWALTGVPIYMLNYLVYAGFLHFTKRPKLSYWSWMLVSPFTLMIWDYMEAIG